MQKLVLLRHGESVWNKENRFTGWTDVDLSDAGVLQAQKAGQLLKNTWLQFRCRLYLGIKKSHQNAGYRFGRSG